MPILNDIERREMARRFQGSRVSTVEAEAQAKPVELPVSKDELDKRARAGKISSTLNIPFELAYENEEIYTQQFRDLDPKWDSNSALDSFKAGIGDFYVGGARALQWLGAPESFYKEQLDYGRRIRNAYTPTIDAGEFTWRSMSDSRWWSTRVARSVPTMLALIPAAVVGHSLGTGVAAAAGAKGLWLTVAGALGGTALSRPIESALEAAQTYDESLALGESEEVASQRADSVFVRNMAIGTPLDMAQLALSFAPLKIPASAVTLRQRFMAAAPRKSLEATIAAGLESGEEGLQNAIQQAAMGKEVDWTGHEITEAMALGLVFGYGLPIAGSVSNVLKGRIINNMPDKLKQEFEATKAALSLSESDADVIESKALDVLVSTPEGQKFVVDEVTKIKDIVEGKEIAPVTESQQESELENFDERAAIPEGEQVEEIDPLSEIVTDEDIDSIGRGDESFEDIIGVGEQVAAEEGHAAPQSFFISEETFQAARESFREKATTGLKAGLDPTVLKDLVVIGAYHIERGARNFAAWSRAMIEQHGEGIKDHLRPIYAKARSMLRKEGKVEPIRVAQKGELKKLIRLTTGQEQLATMIREDVALRAAFKKAEQNARLAYKAGKADALVQAKREFSEALLAARVKAEAFGFKEGFRVGKKLTRKDIVDFYKTEQEASRAAKKQIVDAIKRELPLSIRGKFLDMATKVTGRTNMDKRLDRIAKAKLAVERTKLVEEIKALQQRRDLAGVALDYKRKIDDLVKDLDTKNITQATIDKIRSIREWSARTGEISGIEGWVEDQLGRMQQKVAASRISGTDPRAALSNEDLQTIVDIAQRLKERGELKLRLKGAARMRLIEKAKNDFIQGSHRIGPKERKEHAGIDIPEATFAAYIESLAGWRVPQMIDNVIGLGDEAGPNVKTYKELWRREVDIQDGVRQDTIAAMEAIKKLGIDHLSEERQIAIAINIRAMEGESASEAFLTLMDHYGFQEIPEISDAERGLIEILRQFSNKLGNTIAAYYEETTNEPFPWLPNRILPLKYVREELIRTPEEALGLRPKKFAAVSERPVERRTNPKNKLPRVDILSVFVEGLEDAYWYAYMKPQIDFLKSVMDEKVAAKMGQHGYGWWIDHLHILSNRGYFNASGASSTFNRFLRAARNNITKAILGFKPSTIMLQKFAVFDAMAYAQSLHPLGGLMVFKEFTKTHIIPKYAQAVIESSRKLSLRQGGEYAIRDLEKDPQQFLRNKNSLLTDAFGLMKRFDVNTAAASFKGFESTLTKLGVKNPTAEAEWLIDMSQSSGDVSFRPHVVARGEVARAVFTFGTFMLNRWALMMNDLFVNGLIRSTTWKAKLGASLGIAILVAGQLAEDEARQKMYNFITGKSFRRANDPLWMQTLLALISNIPIFGVVAQDFYRGSSEFPLQKLMFDALEAPIDLLRAQSRKNAGEAAVKATLKGAEAALAVGLGIPGLSTGVDLLERAIIPPKEKGKPRKKKGKVVVAQ